MPYIILLFIAIFPCVHYGNNIDSLSHSFTSRIAIPDFEEDCDFCGGGASGGSFGFTPIEDQSFIGFRSINQHYSTREGMFVNEDKRKEVYQTYQLWGGIKINTKFSISLIVPYSSNYRMTTTGKQPLRGFGDVTVLGNYNLLRTVAEGRNWNHNIRVSAGLKLPVGTYDADNNGSINPGYQLGTGSFDYIGSADYTLSYRNLALQQFVSYTLKTDNKESYKFGNQLNLNTTLLYTFPIKEMKLIPQVGYAYETYEANQLYGYDLNLTGGHISLLKVGLDFQISSFRFGGQFQKPVDQKLNAGLVENKNRSSFYVNYNF